MRIKTNDFEIEGGTVGEIRELLELLSESAPMGESTARGPYEAEYMVKTKTRRFKLTKIEAARVESGEATKEDIARERLERLEAASLSGEPVQVVPSVETTNAEPLY